MKSVPCPHCGHNRIVTAKIPKDMAVILPCPHCHELVVLFRGKVIALNRSIIEHGSYKERISHIAEIVSEFIEPGMFSGSPSDMPPQENNHLGPGDIKAKDATSPITRQEIEQFVRVDLARIDDPAYFRKYFG